MGLESFLYWCIQYIIISITLAPWLYGIELVGLFCSPVREFWYKNYTCELQKKDNEASDNSCDEKKQPSQSIWTPFVYLGLNVFVLVDFVIWLPQLFIFMMFMIQKDTGVHYYEIAQNQMSSINMLWAWYIGSMHVLISITPLYVLYGVVCAISVVGMCMQYLIHHFMLFMDNYTACIMLSCFLTCCSVTNFISLLFVYTIPKKYSIVYTIQEFQFNILFMAIAQSIAYVYFERYKIGLDTCAWIVTIWIFANVLLLLLLKQEYLMQKYRSFIGMLEKSNQEVENIRKRAYEEEESHNSVKLASSNLFEPRKYARRPNTNHALVPKYDNPHRVYGNPNAVQSPGLDVCLKQMTSVSDARVQIKGKEQFKPEASYIVCQNIVRMINLKQSGCKDFNDFYLFLSHLNLAINKSKTVSEVRKSMQTEGYTTYDIRHAFVDKAFHPDLERSSKRPRLSDDKWLEKQRNAFFLATLESVLKTCNLSSTDFMNAVLAMEVCENNPQEVSLDTDMPDACP